MAQQYPNDPIYQPGDVVLVFEHAGVATLVASGVLADGGSPRPAVVLREHPSDRGVLEVAFTDGGQPSSEYIADHGRLRHVPASAPEA